LGILSAALSPQGYEKILRIVEADELLKKSTGQTMFGREEYFVSFLGLPSTSEPWMIQFGGHHLGTAKPKHPMIQITGQRRNQNQSSGEIEFV
jgi:hypothetical protein